MAGQVGKLDGKVIVVTGAAQGIGSAYARGLVEAGARVVANDIDKERLDALVAAVSAERGRGRIVTQVADITDWEAAHDLICAATDQFGRLDALVNNAGLYDVRRAEENEPERIVPQIQVNILGTLYCGIHAMRTMLAGDGGSIVNVTSGALAGLPLRSVYSATKGAIASLTWAWALDMRDEPIRVNAISPLARTRQLEASVNYLHKSPDELMPDIPTEVNAPVLIYLLSEEARDIRGQIVRINDRTLSLFSRPEVMRPGVELVDRSVEAVERAFTDQLRDQLVAVVPPNWSPTAGQETSTVGAQRNP